MLADWSGIISWTDAWLIRNTMLEHLLDVLLYWGQMPWRRKEHISEWFRFVVPQTSSSNLEKMLSGRRREWLNRGHLSSDFEDGKYLGIEPNRRFTVLPKCLRGESSDGSDSLRRFEVDHLSLL